MSIFLTSAAQSNTYLGLDQTLAMKLTLFASFLQDNGPPLAFFFFHNQRASSDNSCKTESAPRSFVVPILDPGFSGCLLQGSASFSNEIIVYLPWVLLPKYWEFNSITIEQILSPYYLQITLPGASGRNQIQAFLNETDQRYTRLQYPYQVSCTKDGRKGPGRGKEGEWQQTRRKRQ